MLAAYKTRSLIEHTRWGLLGGLQFFSIALVVTAVLHLSATQSYAQLVIGQTPGTDYIAWEAEDFAENNSADEATGWIIVGPEGNAAGLPTVEMPHEQLGTASIALPEDSNVGRGAALLDQVGGNDQDWVNYQLQFAEPGTYHLYLHYSMFDRADVTGYGNEDSVFFPREFGVVPTGGRGDNNFWASTPGDITGVGAAFGDGIFEGNFHWWRVTPQDPAVDGEGSELKVVAAADVGTVLDFGMAAREAGTAIDKLVMSTNPDLTSDDLDALPTFRPCPPGSLCNPGDYNEDGMVDLLDFAIQAENFNLSFPIAESFAKGDETGDGKVDLRDFLEARKIFNAPAGAAAIPEPSTTLLAFFAVIGVWGLRRRRSG